MRKKVLIIGTSPDNIGGVAVHIKRLLHLLSDYYDFDIIDEGRQRHPGTFNIRSLNIFTYFRKLFNADVIHIHSGVWFLRLFHVLVCKVVLRKKTIVTVHRDPTIEPHLRCTKRVLKECDHIIVVNKNGYKALSYRDIPDKYHLMPAFLPPIMELEPELPVEVEKYVRTLKKRCTIVLSSNAWKLVLHNGEDLYGLDICIEALHILDQEYQRKDIGLVFVVADTTGSESILEKYKRLLVNWHLEDQILLVEESLSFVRLVEITDAVVRSTNTDGDALTIRESLFLKKPVIASDVVERPEGTILFITRDSYDLARAINELSLERNNNVSNTPRKSIDYKEQYNNIYQN